MGIDAVYEKVDVAPEGLTAFIEQLDHNGYAGINVTVPHKEAVASLLRSVENVAAMAGSVNTVINNNGNLHGESTDGYGLERALVENLGFDLKSESVAFIGCGGATRATALHLATRGVSKLILANRTLSKAESIAEQVKLAAPDCKVEVLGLCDLNVVESGLADVDIVVQATSLGLKEDDPLPVSPALFPDKVRVFDMIYRETPFQMELRKAGLAFVDGRDMLLHQGVRSFQLWTGVAQPPVDAMRKALYEAIDS